MVERKKRGTHASKVYRFFLVYVSFFIVHKISLCSVIILVYVLVV